jgi:hypothetical protein
MLATANLHTVKKALALAAATAAVAFAASTANAADCIDGLRTVESGLVFACEGGPTAFFADEAAAPEFTGSVSSGAVYVAPAPSESRSLIVGNNPTECFPGGYWYMEHDTSYTVMAC